MWTDLVFIIIVLVVAAMAAVGIRAYVLTEMGKDRRARELREWARRHGFAYSATEALMSFRCQPFQCLQKGDYCNSFNVIEGTPGNRPLRAFDYHYYSETGSGGGKDHHYFSAMAIEAGIPLLPLAIRPRGLLDEVTEFIGFEEIGFESAEFREKFVVKSHDRRWAYDVVNQKTMELMLAYPHFLIDFQGSQIMAYYQDEVFTPEEFESALKVVTGIVDGLPESEVRDLKESRSQPRS